MDDWWYMVPTAVLCVWVFIIGLGVGSFLNVVIARLPYQKSIVWPGSRCFSCFRSLRFADNVPIIGYLRLRGRCRFCNAPFSSRYLWVEVGTASALLALFVIEVLARANDAPAFFAFWQRDGLRFDFHIGPAASIGPPLIAWAYFVFHAALLSLLIAAALVDLEHQIIPPQITYLGTLIGLIGATLMPWPVPAKTVPRELLAISERPPLPNDVKGIGMEFSPEFMWAGPGVRIPTGATLWPFAGPPPSWAPPGSWQLGLLNGLIGAAAGMFVGRAVKFLFEVGLGKEALGLGDADLLMMIGAFLGWQPAVMALPMGALVTLPVVLPLKVWGWSRGREVASELPFGPGIAAGAVVTWLCWPWLGELMRMMFDPFMLGFTVVIMGGGFLVAGLLLRRRTAVG